MATGNVQHRLYDFRVDFLREAVQKLHMDFKKGEKEVHELHGELA